VKILTIGISGFIGGSFGRYAAQLGHEVMGSSRQKQSSKEWSGLYTPANDSDELRELIHDFRPDVVVNAAGTASVGASVEDPLNDFRGSVQTCADVLDAVRRSGIRPLVVVPSSAAVYGNPASLPVSEDAALQPISPYGFHKVMCELLAREYAECFGLHVLVCRFFSVFGPAQRRLLVWELYQQLSGQEPIAWLNGTGNETRDFLYIDDLNAALLGLIDSFRRSDINYVSVNVAAGVETGVLQLAEMIRDFIAPEKEIRCRGNLHRNDPLRWRADVSKLQSLLPDWSSRTLQEGLGDCTKAWRQ
jgi:nucleoside-diphosphate-sugar epimerase